VRAKDRNRPRTKQGDIVNKTSDGFFAELPENELYDIIFIDGLHHSDQVTRDIENSLNHLDINGTIVCHDMLPESEAMQIVPRESARWMGDCWKSWAHFRMTNSALSMLVIDSDCGLGIIRKGNQKLFQTKSGDMDIDYAFFKKSRKRLMNVISVAEFQERLKNSAL
jgi:hypothetical protein